MSDNHVGVAQKSSVGFKLQISKEKVEQMQLEKNLQVMDEVISKTQQSLNIKRFLLLFISYVISTLFINCIVYNFLHSSNYSLYFYTIFNILATLPFLYLVRRNAPISEADIKETLEKIQQKK